MSDDYSMPTDPSSAAEPARETDAAPESDGVFRESLERLSPRAELPLPLSMQVEGLLFVAPGPAPVSQLATALDVPVGRVESALAELEAEYLRRGIRLQRNRDRVQLTTAPSLADKVETFLGLDSITHLSRAALETLAIIAYQQPVTRPQLDAVRGVNSDSVLKNLLTKGLIEEIGRSEGPGRPVLYSTTPEFLQHFGLSSLADLPPIDVQQVPDLAPAPAKNGNVLKE